MDMTVQEHTDYAIKQLKDQATTARLVGWKPHMAKLSCEHVKHLLRHHIIKLPRNAAGVRCQMELSTGRLSHDSHRMICQLI